MSLDEIKSLKINQILWESDSPGKFVFDMALSDKYYTRCTDDSFNMKNFYDFHEKDKITKVEVYIKP